MLRGQLLRRTACLARAAGEDGGVDIVMLEAYGRLVECNREPRPSRAMAEVHVLASEGSLSREGEIESAESLERLARDGQLSGDQVGRRDVGADLCQPPPPALGPPLDSRPEDGGRRRGMKRQMAEHDVRAGHMRPLMLGEQL